jgi:hypothetical protein
MIAHLLDDIPMEAHDYIPFDDFPLLLALPGHSVSSSLRCRGITLSSPASPLSLSISPSQYVYVCIYIYVYMYICILFAGQNGDGRGRRQTAGVAVEAGVVDGRGDQPHGCCSYLYIYIYIYIYIMGDNYAAVVGGQGDQLHGCCSSYARAHTHVHTQHPHASSSATRYSAALYW